MRSGVKVFARRDIEANDEIRIDYRLNAFDGDGWTCECGSANCMGWVVGSFSPEMDEGRRHAYLPYAPPFIEGVPAAQITR